MRVKADEQGRHGTLKREPEDNGTLHRHTLDELRRISDDKEPQEEEN